MSDCLAIYQSEDTDFEDSKVSVDQFSSISTALLESLLLASKQKHYTFMLQAIIKITLIVPFSYINSMLLRPDMFTLQSVGCVIVA